MLQLYGFMFGCGCQPPKLLRTEPASATELLPTDMV
jgi:hypothetical protein